jgi:hypothetical protein
MDRCRTCAWWEPRAARQALRYEAHKKEIHIVARCYRYNVDTPEDDACDEWTRRELSSDPQ